MPAIAETTKDKPADQTDKPKQEAEPIGKNALAFMDQSLGITGRKKKEKAEKPEPEKVNVLEDGDEVEESAAPKKKPTAKVAAPPAQPQPIDEDKLGEAVGRAVGKAMEKRDKPVEPAAPELPAEVKAKLKMYERLEKYFPDKYKGHSTKFLANAKKFTEYSEKWEADHPGQEFNDEDPEHEAFRASLEAETEYDEDDHVAALADEIADGKVAKVTKDFEQKLEPIRRREKLAEKHRELVATRDNIGNGFWQRLGEQLDDFKDVVDVTGGLSPEEAQRRLKSGQKITPLLKIDVLNKIAETDPEKYAIAVNGRFARNDDGSWTTMGARVAEGLAQEIYALDNALVEYGETNPVHQFLSEFVEERTRKLLAKPVENQMDDQGRRFLSRADYNNLPADRRKDHWTYSTEDVGVMLAGRVAKQTQAHLQAEEEKFAARAKARGLLPNGNPSRVAERQPERRRETDDEQDAKPISPTTAMMPRVASARGKNAAGPNSPMDAWMTRAIRGR